MADRDDLIKGLKDENNALRESLTLRKGILTEESKRAAEQQIYKNNQELINQLLLKGNELTKEEIELLSEIEKEQKDITEETKKGNKEYKKRIDLARQFNSALRESYNFLIQQDKAIKSTNLTLGLTGTKAAAMRQSFEESAGFMSRLGGGLEDAATIISTFANETGRAHVLTGDMLKNIEAIGVGTGLGVEQAAKLGARFEFMGFNAKSTMDYVQGVVETSERMGVNTTKVLQVVADNFKELSTFTFQKGVASFAKMAQDAEKTRVSMESALGVAEATRGLENVIDLGAQLQVMGGEFAKMDPFQWLYIARNEPDKMIEKISEMTTGMYTLKKTADGTFEKIISPADRDRLTQVAKSLGIAKDEMFEIAQRRFDIIATEKELAGMGLSDREKELLAGAAAMNKETGRFQVNLAGTMTNISALTKEQAKTFTIEQKTLEKRAEEAQTFEQVLKATLNELKSTLVPALRNLNEWVKNNRDVIIKFTEGIAKFMQSEKPLASIARKLVAAALLWKGVTTALNITAGALKASVAQKFSGTAGKAGGMAAGVPGSDFTKTGMVRKGAAGLRKAKGMQALGAGAGAGAAMAGAGAGIMLAAKGLSELADSMSKLTPEQAENLQKIATTMAVTFPLAAIGIALVAAVAAPAAGPLLALGAALLMVGGAVGIAAAGIGFMANGFGEMFESSKGAGDDMMKISGGIVGIAASLGAAAITLPSAIGLSMVLRRMAKSAPELATVGDSLKNIKEGLSGSAADYERIADAIKTISGVKLRRNSAIDGLADLMSKPLRVEFDKSSVNLENTVTLNIDGNRFMRKVYNTELAVQAREDRRNNK